MDFQWPITSKWHRPKINDHTVSMTRYNATCSRSVKLYVSSRWSSQSPSQLCRRRRGLLADETQSSCISTRKYYLFDENHLYVAAGRLLTNDGDISCKFTNKVRICLIWRLFVTFVCATRSYRCSKGKGMFFLRAKTIHSYFHRCLKPSRRVD